MPRKFVSRDQHAARLRYLNRPNGCAMDARTSATYDRYPYALHGRVEQAVLNCPRCGLVIRYKFRTAIRQKCPGCSLTLYISLKVSVGTPHKGMRHRPPDTVLLVPPQLAETVAARPDSPGTIRDRTVVRVTDIAAMVAVAPADDDQLVAELADASLDPMPTLVLGVWEPGTRIHEFLAGESESEPDREPE